MSIHHHHGHHHIDPHEYEAGQKNIFLAFMLNFCFSIMEAIGGYLTNSMAVMSDALHDFGDSMALLSAYVLEKFSIKKADRKYTLGYRRFSILAALINAVILCSGSLYMIWEAFGRVMAPEVIHPKGVIWMAILGISINAYAAFRLSKNAGLNHKVVMLHMLEDLLGWIAVLIVSIILLFKPWFILDSILSIVISVIILRGVYARLKEVFSIFLHRFPDNVDREKLIEELKKIKGVLDLHELKGFSIDGNTHQLSVHVVVPNEMTMDGLELIKEEASSIMERFKIAEFSLEFEALKYSDHT